MNQVSGQFAQYNDPKWNLIDLIHSVSYPANHYTSIISLAFGVVFFRTPGFRQTEKVVRCPTFLSGRTSSGDYGYLKSHISL